jgi:hypothetical protein
MNGAQHWEGWGVQSSNHPLPTHRDQAAMNGAQHWEGWGVQPDFRHPAALSHDSTPTDLLIKLRIGLATQPCSTIVL